MVVEVGAWCVPQYWLAELGFMMLDSHNTLEMIQMAYWRLQSKVEKEESFKDGEETSHSSSDTV